MFGMIGPPASMMILSALSARRPLGMDNYIFSLDGLLGFQPSFWAGQLLRAHGWLHVSAVLAYNILPGVYVGVFALYLLQRPMREAGRVALAFVLNLFAALPIYLLFPAYGPHAAFHSFPELPREHVALQLIAATGTPNAIPSVHFSSALLILWFLCRWRIGKVFGMVFLALTVLATLGSGEHYLFDLVMAFPYAAMVEWAAGHSMHLRKQAYVVVFGRNSAAPTSRSGMCGDRGKSGGGQSLRENVAN
jgi:hypothetical protein